MTMLYSQSEKERAFKTKRTMFFFWLALFVVWLAAVGALIGVNAYGVLVHYSRAFRPTATALCIVFTVLFFWFTLFFFSVKYRLTKKFCRMLSDADTGESEYAEGTFICFNEDNELKDGVNCYSMQLNCKPLSRGDITLRKTLIEVTRERPPFKEGQRIKIGTHANILMGYEILSPPPEGEEAVSGQAQ